MRNSTYKYLESELFEYPYIERHIANVRQQVITPHREIDENIGGGKSNTNVSTVEIAATRLITDKRLIQLENIKRAIETVYNKSDNTSRDLMDLYYFKKPRLYTPDGIADKLHISRRQFYNIKKKIITELANELGIMH